MSTPPAASLPESSLPKPKDHEHMAVEVPLASDLIKKPFLNLWIKSSSSRRQKPTSKMSSSHDRYRRANETTTQPKPLRKTTCKVFVVAPETRRGQTEEHAETYWKATITGLYEGKKKSGKFADKVYARCEWFYERHDLSDVEFTNKKFNKAQFITRLGEKELVKSNSVDVIAVQAIEDKCEVYHFDDDQGIEEEIPAGSWFSRFEMTVDGTRQKKGKTITIAKIKNIKKSKCHCNGIYDPKNDRQIYCGTCEKWFHNVCFLDPPSMTTAPEIPLADQIKSISYIRGPGNDEIPRSWHLTGTGCFLLAFEEWSEQNPQATDDQLEEYLEDLDEGLYNVIKTEIARPKLKCRKCRNLV